MPLGGYDGTIRIDSRIDPKGFNKGVQGLIGALKPLALVIATVFSVGAIVNFGKTAVQEASNMASALIGLQSIVEGTGNSFTQAQAFIDDYVSDGLVPAQNAITAYKNLLARGYDTSQVEQTLVILKDAAAFGRQSSLTLGQAVQSATEGLKNENSILVDNAGITKNVSVLWKEYADEIGTTVSALTQQQKIQAEVNGLLRESRFQVGDAAKLAGTYAGQISALGVSVLNLKIAFGNVLIPIIQTFLPIIRAAIDALTVFFNRLATIVSILFGVDIGAARKSMEDTASATQDAADAQGNLADNTEAAGKAAKGALASFDELNVLAQDTGTGADAGVPDIAGGGIEVPPLETDQFDEGLQELRDKVEAWKQGFLEFTQPIRDAIVNDLFPVLEKLGGQIWDGLVWIWENILKPFGDWLIRVFAPIFIQILAAAFDVFSSTLDTLAPYIVKFWEVLKPVAEIIGKIIVNEMYRLIEALKVLNVWIQNNQEEWALIVTVVGIVAAILTALALGPITLVIGAIAAMTFIIVTAGKHFEFLGNVVKIVFTGIFNTIKGIVNNIIGLINSFISRVVNGVNSILSSINAVGSVLPGFSGVSLVTAPQIPRLATGAVIPPNSNFLAMLGDQKSGRNLEAPENLIRQIIREEMGTVQSEVTINFSGSLAGLVRELKPYIDKENVRIGGSLVKSGVTR